jgi:type I restriction enzyme S subunit
MSDWQEFRLEELASPDRNAMATGPFGSAISSKHFVSSGVPVIRGSNLSVKVGTRLIDDGLAFLEESKAADFERSVAKSGDLVFTCWGTIGQIGLVDRNARYERYIVSNKQMKMTPDQKRVDSLFLYYALSAPEAVERIQSSSIGSSVPGFNLTQLRSVTVRCPSMKEQLAIASLLGALDDKISVNDRIAGTTDALRSAILEETQQREPASFTHRPLSSVANFVNGRAFTKNATGTGRMVVRIAEINSGPGTSTVYNDLVVDEKHLARPGDILFSWSGTLAVARWYRPEAIINQHIFKVEPKENHPQWLAFEATKSKLARYRGVAADKATTMGHIQRRHLDEEVLVPSPEALDRLDQRVAGLWHRALAAERESLTLAELRDRLLPELMSGRLRIKDAEKVVEDAV